MISTAEVSNVRQQSRNRFAYGLRKLFIKPLATNAAFSTLCLCRLLSPLRARGLITLGRRGFPMHLFLDQLVYDSVLLREQLTSGYATEEIL